MPFISVDWGSSCFRAFLISDEGEKLDEIKTSQGIFQFAKNDFAGYLAEVCQLWLGRYPGLPVLMSGMVGSRNGWQETPYLSCPVTAGQLSDRLISIELADSEKIALTHQLNIIPGVCCGETDFSSDVMRGEEIQIFGALKLLNKLTGLVCLPGTHSKWAEVNRGSLTGFSTFFTGELYATLRQHSSLTRTALEDEATTEKMNDSVFLRGVAFSQEKGGLLHQVFKARSGVLLNALDEKDVNSFLSGMIIGNEFHGAKQLYPEYSEFILVGSPELQQLYSKASEVYGMKAVQTDPDEVFIQGSFEIAKTNFI